MSEIQITQVEPIVFWAVQFHAWISIILLTFLCFGFAVFASAYLLNRGFLWWVDHWCFIRTYSAWRYGFHRKKQNQELLEYCWEEYERIKNEEASDEYTSVTH